MNTKTRAVIALLFALFSVILALSKCHNRQVKQYQLEHTWTPDLEAQMRDVFYSQAANIITDDSSKAAYADCALSKIKALFPKGLASMNLAEMTDSTKIAIMKIGAECSSELTKRINVWQPELVQQLKLQLYSYPETKLLPVAAKPEYVDCLTFRIKTEFPKGLSVAGKDSVKKFIEKARRGCLVLVVNKYKKQKLRDTVNNK